MQLAFRIECPHCGWGFKWRNRFINQGWLGCICENSHCKQKFVTKVSVREVKVEIQKELPDGQPCNSKLTLNANSKQSKFEYKLKENNVIAILRHPQYEFLTKEEIIASFDEYGIQLRDMNYDEEDSENIQKLYEIWLAA